MARIRSILNKLPPHVRVTAKVVGRVLTWHPLGAPVPSAKTVGWRRTVRQILWGTLYRLAFVPILLTILWAILLIGLTHPRRSVAMVYPESYDLAYDNVSFTTADGVTLRGWLLNSLKVSDIVKSGAWKKLRPAVVVCHDYGANRDEFLYPVGVDLVKAGFDVLLFDFRGHGQSGDAPSSFGVTESADVVAAVNFLKRQPGIDPDRIGVFGSGMGAYAAMQAAPRCQGVRAVVADSVYRSVPSFLRAHMKALHLPAMTGTALAWGMSLYYGHRLMDQSTDEAAAQLAPRPLLLISGANDKFCPPQSLDPTVAAGGDHVARLVVADATHCQTFTHPSTCKLVVQFFRTHLANQDSKAPAAH